LSHRLSVLLPVRNHARYLGAAIESILGQSFRDFELLVLDDASTDGSRELLQGLSDSRLRVLRNEEHLGLAATLNRGLLETDATWVARQDADDLSEPDRLRRQLAFLEEHPHVSLLGTEGRLLDERDQTIGRLRTSTDHGTLLFGLLFDNCFVHTSVVFRRDHVLELGGYDVTLKRAQDYDLWIRLARGRTVANLSERLVGRRLGHLPPAEDEDDYSRLNRGILARHHLNTLGAAPSEQEHAQIDAFRRGLHRDDVPAMLRLHARLLHQFSKRHPTAVRSRDFRRSVARQLARMALARANRSPWLILRVLAHDPMATALGLMEAVRGRLWLYRARREAR
jgi:glycosyltransferase involved in cell wall biosynthesis